MLSIFNIVSLLILYTRIKINFKHMSNLEKLVNKLPRHKMVLNPFSYRMAHPVYSKQSMEEIKVTHQKPNSVKDYISYYSVQAARRGFDFFSGYNPDKMN